MIPHELMKLSYWTWAACCWPGRLLLILVSFPFAQKRQNSQSPEDYMSIKFPPPWQGKGVKCQGMPGEIWKLRFHLPPATTRELQYKAFEKSRGALESKQKHDGLVDLTKHWGWTVTTSKTCAETGPKKRLQESEEGEKTSLFLKNEGRGQKQKLDWKAMAGKM